MPKLLWVALPLLLAGALIGLQALRGRPLLRHALNVWSSVLLMVYVLATAGLGIFWVANQQLPVFDWHYLFGYGTVLLLALHLVFNFRTVWRHLTRRKQAMPAAKTSLNPGRREAFGTVAALFGAGAAFTLGLRQGRSDLLIEWPAAGGATTTGPSSGALELVERFHAFSSHSRAGVLLRSPGTEWDAEPPSFKRYPGAQRVALPRPGGNPGTPFSLAALGAVLWHTSGVTDTRSSLHLRASPSSGALFSTELYVATRAIEGLPTSLWHYDPQTHTLERLAGELTALDAALGSPGNPALRDAPAAVVATAVFRRTGRKYRDRTYRYVLADLGHALENLRVAAGAVGMHAVFTPGFDESRSARALGLDEAEEGVLSVAALAGNGQHGGVTARSTLRWESPQPGFSDATPRDVTAMVHLATSLRVAEAATPAATVTMPGAVKLPPAPAKRLDVFNILANRRSERRFATNTPLPLDALAAVLARMALHSEPILSPAVRVNLVVNHVAGLAPGAYRYDPTHHALMPRRAGIDLRRAAHAAALNQDVIGDAAAVFVLSIDRATFAADPLGPARGYRHAFLEAGFVGERIYLEAGARGLGACAVGAFYDDEAETLIALDPQREWIVHFAALGVPAG